MYVGQVGIIPGFHYKCKQRETLILVILEFIDLIIHFLSGYIALNYAPTSLTHIQNYQRLAQFNALLWKTH